MSETSALETLIDQMHRALLVADFVALQSLIGQLDAALAGFSAPRDAAQMERLRRKAERNAACALAAGRGVRAALGRLVEIRQAAHSLVTYDGRGRRPGPQGSEGLSRRF